MKKKGSIGIILVLAGLVVLTLGVLVGNIAIRQKQVYQGRASGRPTLPVTEPPEVTPGQGTGTITRTPTVVPTSPVTIPPTQPPTTAPTEPPPPPDGDGGGTGGIPGEMITPTPFASPIPRGLCAEYGGNCRNTCRTGEVGISIPLACPVGQPLCCILRPPGLPSEFPTPAICLPLPFTAPIPSELCAAFGGNCRSTCRTGEVEEVKCLGGSSCCREHPSICPSIIPTRTPTRTPTPTKPSCLKSKGDANCDGKVDLIDFEIWRKEFTGASTTKTADFNNDNKVDLIDFEIWRKNFLTISPTPTPTITLTPTPTTSVTRVPSPTRVISPTPTPTLACMWCGASCVPYQPNLPCPTIIGFPPVGGVGCKPVNVQGTPVCRVVQTNQP